MTELITNGTFDADTSGWSASNATLSVVGGVMRVANTGDGTGIAYQSFPTDAGQIYRVRYDATQGTSTNCRVSVGTSAGSASIVNGDAIGTGQSFTFTAAGSTTFIRCQTRTTTAGFYNDFDNLSVQALPPRKPARSSYFLG